LNIRFFVAWLVVAVIWFAGAYLINAVWIIEDWYPVEILRGWDEELKRYHFMVLPFIFWSGTSVWIYQNFERRQPWLARGLAYGLVLSLITIVPMRMFNYASFKLPGPVLIKEGLLWTAMTVLIGAVIAWIYRAPSVRTVTIANGA
jgi:hypothetical protein